MTTAYPGAIDAFTNPSSTDDLDTAGVELDIVVSNLNDAVEAIETELGTNPSGGAATVKDRLGVIGNFASPNPGGIVTGNFYDQSFHGANASTTIGVANRMELYPFFTSVPFAIDQIGVAVSTLLAASYAKVQIYATGSNGWPAGLLYESGNLDCSSTGYKFASLSFTFQSGTMYWLGCRTSSTQTLRSIAATSITNLGLNGSNGTNYFTALRRTVTFANAAPDPWSFTGTDLAAAAIPWSVRFRAA